MIFAAAVWIRLQSFQTATGAELRGESPIGGTATTERGRAERRPDGSTDVMIAGSDPGTIVSSTEGNAAGASAPMASRDQRYRELLQSPPPPPAPSRVAEKPSLLDRMVAPIANALGIQRPSSKPQQQASAQVPQQSQLQRRPATEHVQENPLTPEDQKRPGQAPEPEEPVDDGESDIIPPQLLAAEFMPPEVQDGESTLFGAIINDNLTGVRSVSGVIASPSGSLQGFSATKEGETNRFIARINIPKEAPSGIWEVKYLTLTDNASNSVNLNASQGALPPSTKFKVISSRSDASGPQLKAIWLERQAMRGGDKNMVFVQAEDDQAGVSQVSGTFVSPAKHARIGFGCRLGSTGAWECQLAPPTCLDCGVWRLEQIQLQDKANNLTTFRADHEIVRTVVVDISSDICDAAPPIITSITIEPQSVTNTQANLINVTATATDEGGCGVASLSGQAVPPGGIGGQRRPVIFKKSQDGQTFVGTIDIPAMAAKGLWTLTWVQALDTGHNLRAYSSSDPVVAKATFKVE